MTYDDDFRLSFLRRSAPVCFRSRKVGQYVIDLCKYHRLPAEVQFLSLEIFSVLCKLSLNTLAARLDVGNSSCFPVNADAQSSSYIHILDHLTEPVVIASMAVQIASKVACQKTSIQAVELQNFLRKHQDISITLGQLIALELTILQRLEYSLPPCPLATCQDFLEVSCIHPPTCMMASMAVAQCKRDWC